MNDDRSKVQRHAAIDRAFHWLTALTMTALLVTGLLPVAGVHFAWLGVHWVAGLLLTLLVLLHALRALFWQNAKSMVLRARDLTGAPAGKYTLAQKLMHLGWLLAALVAIATGLLLLRKAGVPFLERDPYVRSLASWGVITLLHDLAALLALFLVLVHVYFAILPEKRAYLRAMLSGKVTRAELAPEHDLQRMDRGE